MSLEQHFQRFVEVECEPGTKIEFRALTSKKEYSTGRYFTPRGNECARVTITFGTDVADNIYCMLHELSHHLDWVGRGKLKGVGNLGHPTSFWRILWRLALKYEAALPSLGLIKSIFTHMGRQNGTYLHVARQMNVPGAESVWQDILAWDEIMRRRNFAEDQRRRASYESWQENKALDFLFKES